MKTQIMFGMIALLVLSSLAFVVAEDNSSDNAPILISAPTLEENSSVVEQELEMNESVSTGTILGQQIKTWFTFNKEKKMEAELKLAKLRLIQANIAAKNNNTEAMQKALEAHERIMNKVQEQMKNYDGSSKFNELNDSAVKLVGIERAIQVHERRVAYLQDVLSNANLTEQEKQVLQMRLEKAQNSTAHLINVSEAKKEDIKTRLMAVGNLTEEQAQNLIEQREANREQRQEEGQQLKQQIREHKNNSD